MDAPVLPAQATVEVEVGAAPEALWPFVSDPATPARFSTELVEARFSPGDGPHEGAVIAGTNQRGDFSWSTTSVVTACVAPSLFEWRTGPAAAPGATWTFRVAARGEGSVLSHTVVLHAGASPLAPAIEAEPERAREIVAGRLAEVVANMQRTIDGIAGLAASGGSNPSGPPG